MKTSELLAEGRDNVHMGWTQGHYTDNEGNVCAIQGLKRAVMNHLTDGGVQAYEPAEELLRKKLREVLGEENFVEGVSIPTMNDHYRTRKEDVEAAYDKAILESEEHGD